MKRRYLRLRMNWAIALQPLLISFWLLAIAFPSWSNHLQTAQLINDSPHLVVQIFVIHSIILLAPISIVLWLRRLALHSPSSDSTATWLSYNRWLNWVVWGMWGFWTFATLTLSTGSFIDYILGGKEALPSQWAIKLSLFILLPAVVVVACNALSHPVYTKIRGLHYTQKDLIWQSILSQAVIYLPMILFGIGIVAFLEGKTRLGIIAFSAALACLILLASLLRKSQDITPHALTVGELRDRIFALAEIAGVKLQQIYVIPANKGQLANAFASQGNNILLTDYLLQKLSKQEVDAIVGHELGHLKHQHPKKLGMVLYITNGVLGGILSVCQGLHLIPVAFGFSLLAFYFVSQHFENVADAESVAIAQYPEALITGLIKLTHLNMMPLESGKQISTHPSTLDRAQAIAKKANISPTRLQDILNNSDRSHAEHYTLPPNLSDEEAIFSTTFKSSLVLRYVWVSIFVMTLTPALIALLAQLADGKSKTLIYLVGVFVTIGLYSIISDFVSGWGYADLQQRLSTKLQRQGINVRNAIFVSFAPASQPLVYEGLSEWDIGFLFISSIGKGTSQQNCLCYIGEQTRFSLYPEQVSDIKLGSGHPKWWKNAHIYITWYDKARDTAGTFNLHPANQNILAQVQDEKAIRALNQQLKAWWEKQQVELELPDVLAQLGTPNIGTVTSLSIKDSLKSTNLINRVKLPVIVAIAFNILFGLSFGASCYVVLVAIVTVIFAMIPYWRYRDSA